MALNKWLEFLSVSWQQSWELRFSGPLLSLSGWHQVSIEGEPEHVLCLLLFLSFVVEFGGFLLHYFFKWFFFPAIARDWWSRNIFLYNILLIGWCHTRVWKYTFLFLDSYYVCRYIDGFQEPYMVLWSVEVEKCNFLHFFKCGIHFFFP